MLVDSVLTFPSVKLNFNVKIKVGSINVENDGVSRWKIRNIRRPTELKKLYIEQMVEQFWEENLVNILD